MNHLYIMWIISLLPVVLFGQPKMEYSWGSDNVHWSVCSHKVNHETEIWFTHMGDEPLIIRTAKSNSGDMVVSWPREPVMQGERKKFKIRFHTGNRSHGRLKRHITIYSNLPEDKGVRVLKIDVRISE